VNLAFHDAEFASVGLPRVDARNSSSVRSLSSRTSDISVASGSPASRSRVETVHPICRDRFLRPSVKRRRHLRSEMPSIAEGHSRTHVNRCRSRVAVTCVSASIRPSSPLHPLRRDLAFAKPRLQQARSPSLLTNPSRCSREERARASLDQVDAQRFLQQHITTHGHTLERPIFTDSDASPPKAGTKNPASTSITLSYGEMTSPCRRRAADAGEP
jgi:hypothetical protein